jgi:hypothetical protein
MSYDLYVLSDALRACARHWKEAPKVVKAKMGLLRSAMQGYGMKGSSATDLLYSVCVCGLWHPAATQHFSQHWNEQGISRCVPLFAKHAYERTYLGPLEGFEGLWTLVQKKL